jgi:hypothetical protein
VNRRDRILVILFTPGKLISRPANGPSAKAYRRDVQIRITKSTRGHKMPLLERIQIAGECLMNRKWFRLNHRSAGRKKKIAAAQRAFPIAAH